MILAAGTRDQLIASSPSRSDIWSSSESGGPLVSDSATGPLNDPKLSGGCSVRVCRLLKQPRGAVHFNRVRGLIARPAARLHTLSPQLDRLACEPVSEFAVVISQEKRQPSA